MSYKELQRARRTPFHGEAKEVLIHLCDRIDSKECVLDLELPDYSTVKVGYCYPSNQDIALGIGLSGEDWERIVSRCLQALEEQGYISRWTPQRCTDNAIMSSVLELFDGPPPYQRVIVVHLDMLPKADDSPDLPKKKRNSKNVKMTARSKQTADVDEFDEFDCSDLEEKEPEVYGDVPIKRIPRKAVWHKDDDSPGKLVYMS